LSSPIVLVFKRLKLRVFETVELPVTVNADD
jgi:hypothetical protein